MGFLVDGGLVLENDVQMGWPSGLYVHSAGYCGSFFENSMVLMSISQGLPFPAWYRVSL